MAKVLYVISRLGGGGAERAAADASRELAREHDVVVVSFHSGEAYEHGGRHIDLARHFNSRPSFFEKIQRLFSKTAQFRKVLKDERPDFIISYSDNLNIISLLARRTGLKGRYIVNTQIPPSKIYTGPYRLVYGTLIRWLYREANAVVALSEGVKRDLVEHFGVPADRIHVIHNPVDVALAESKSREPIAEEDLFSGVPTILNVGRLVAQKNQRLLLEAFRRVREVEPSRLVILGTGVLEPQLKALTAELGLEDDVVFLGWRANPFQYMARADLFVLSSDFEGFGNVIVEAMACGCPVVSTDCPYGPDEIITSPEVGVLTPVNDAAALAEAMIGLLRDTPRRKAMGAAGARRSLDFDVAVLGERYRALVARLG